MQLGYRASLDLARLYTKQLAGLKNEIVLCPDYLSLPAVSAILKKSGLLLGAQDSAASARGAYTGEVSPADLKALGVKYVILGHSERREHLHENSAIINAKIKAALAAGLTPVLCVGEKIAERESGEARPYLAEELRHALKGVKIKRASDLVIAYEPVWAISTNKDAKPIDAISASDMLSFIQSKAANLLGKKSRVLYGGSVLSGNAADFSAQPVLDGFLVGGASLKLKDFKIICS